MSILVVEDSADDLELTLLALQASGLALEIDVARDGRAALDFLVGDGEGEAPLNEDPPQLILLDLKLPKVDGLEVLGVIKDDPSTRLIPVVVFTSSVEESDIAQACALGANSYIQKPVSFAEFAPSVGRVARFWLQENALPPPVS